MRNLPTLDDDKYNSFAGNKVCAVIMTIICILIRVIGLHFRRLRFGPYFSDVSACLLRYTDSRDSRQVVRVAPVRRIWTAPAHDGVLRADRRTVTNPNLTLSPASNDTASGKLNTVSASATPLGQQHPQLGSHGAHTQLPTSRRGSPPSLLESLNATTRSVPATPLGIPNSAVHILKSPGTPHTPETQGLNTSRFCRRECGQCRRSAGVPVEASIGPIRRRVVDLQFHSTWWAG